MEVKAFKEIGAHTHITYGMLMELSEAQLYLIEERLKAGELCHSAYDPSAESQLFIEHIGRLKVEYTKEKARKIERNRVLTLKWCCPSLYREIAKDEMITVVNHILFEHAQKTNYRAYFLSDGGHGGAIRIEHCPFCGAKLSDYLSKLD